MNRDSADARDVGHEAKRADLARKLTVLLVGQELLTALLTEPCAYQDRYPSATDLIGAMERAVDQLARMHLTRSAAPRSTGT